jgi:Leucine-rich repeat (LRR) protein
MVVGFTIHHSGSIKIPCFFDNELLFDELKVAYTCTVTDLMTNKMRRTISNVSGEHIPDTDDGNITQIHIINQQMEYFPIGFTKFFEHIVAIHAGRNKLSYLEKNDLKEFTKMRFLYLYSNWLKVLESDVFQHNAALEYISFYNNRLVHIGSKILLPLKRLKTAYFNKNICVDKQAASDQGISELRLEISERCSNITDEDLMRTLKESQVKIYTLEKKVDVISQQLATVIEFLRSLNSTD